MERKGEAIETSKAILPLFEKNAARPKLRLAEPP